VSGTSTFQSADEKPVSGSYTGDIIAVMRIGITGIEPRVISHYTHRFMRINEANQIPQHANFQFDKFVIEPVHLVREIPAKFLFYCHGKYFAESMMTAIAAQAAASIPFSKARASMPTMATKAAAVIMGRPAGRREGFA